MNRFEFTLNYGLVTTLLFVSIYAIGVPISFCNNVITTFFQSISISFVKSTLTHSLSYSLNKSSKISGERFAVNALAAIFGYQCITLMTEHITLIEKNF